MRMSDLPSETDDKGPGAPEGPAEPPAEPPADARADPPESALDTDRYGHLSLATGEVVIYDRETPEMWVQSDFAVEVRT